MLKKFIATLLAIIMFSSFCGIHSSAAALEPVYMNRRIVGYRQPDGSVLFAPQEDAKANGNALYFLLDSDNEKTIILPRERIEIQRVLHLRSNTTLIAEGAEIYQTQDKPILLNDCTETDFGSIENVTVRGGNWRIKNVEADTYVTTTIRFIHGKNITVEGCEVGTNYESHSLEFIACKDVVVDNCVLLASGKKRADSLEEALQIDIATKMTTPFAAEYGDEFVQGQTCQNITVKNCVIRGSRGICANKTATENKKWYGRHHKNITLLNNDITGMTAEAVALHNTMGATVKNNVIRSKGGKKDNVYSIGLNIASFGKNAGKAESKFVISDNDISGKRSALLIGTYENKQKFKSAKITGNKLRSTYAYNKKNQGFRPLYTAYCKTVSIKNNKTYCTKNKTKHIFTKYCDKVTKKNNKAYVI